MGFDYPSGIFICHDFLIRFNSETSLYIVAGLSTTYLILYGFGGIELDLPLGFKILLEGAYGGNTDFLTKPQEAFFSAGVNYTFIENVTFNFVFRIDQDLVRRTIIGYFRKF